MKKISFTVLLFSVVYLSYSQAIQQPNSTTSSGKRSWAGTDSAGAHTFVEQNPEFPGGDRELLNLIKTKMQYPQMERDNHIEGTVLVRFLINEDGSVSNATIVKKVSPGLDKEAERLVYGLPLFKPGRQQGKAVKVYFNLPIVFKL